jgi:hypothetical protein
MPIFQAIGLGMLIIVLKCLVPEILAEGQKTVLAFLHGATVSAEMATQLAASAETSRRGASFTTPPPLPQARQITRF